MHDVQAGAAQLEHERQVGVVLLQPPLRRHAHVGAGGVADHGPADPQLAGAERGVGAGSGEDGHVMTAPAQAVRQRPGVRLEPAGERLDDGEARGGDQTDPHAATARCRTPR